jgi:hypothetical protein
MSRYIVLREKGSTDTLLVDKATRQVTILDAAATKAVEAFAGLPAAHGEFDIALSISYRDKAPARMFYAEEAPLSVAS